MTRERLDDFVQFKKYVDNYRLDDLLAQAHFEAGAKQMHKQYFCSVTWHAEIAHNTRGFKHNAIVVPDEVRQRIFESISDFGSSFFVWVQGAYKASLIMLRVGIENYVRAICSLENPALAAELNVYSLFEGARGLSVFNGHEDIRRLFNNLHSDYKRLCSDVHTADVSNMAKISSLAELPKFDLATAADVSAAYVRITRNVNSLLSLHFYDFLYKMHYRNRQNVLDGLTRSIRAAVNGPNLQD